MACPNKNNEIYKATVKELGEVYAYSYWYINEQNFLDHNSDGTVNQKFKENAASKGIEFAIRERVNDFDRSTSTDESISLEEFESQRQQIQANIDADVVYDTQLKQSAKVSQKKGSERPTITVNPNLLFADTLTHEYGHIFIEAIGGLDNPLIQSGINQLKDTQLYKDISQQYSERSEAGIQKEVLAQAIGKEGADIFDARKKTLIDRFNKWLDLFFNRVRAVLGLEHNVAKELARQIINTNIDVSTSITDVYYQKIKGRSLQNLEKITDKIVNRLNIQLNRYSKILEEGEPIQQEVLEDIQQLIEELTKSESKKGFIHFVNTAEGRLQSANVRLNKMRKEKEVDPKQLQQIKQYIKAYKDISNMVADLKNDAAFKEDMDKIMAGAQKAISLYGLAESKYYSLAKDYLASLLSKTAKNPTELLYREKFETEFEKQNPIKGLTFRRFTLDGEKVTPKEHSAAKDRYVQKNLDTIRHKIEEEEYNRLLEIMDRLPNDNGLIDNLYDWGLVNDDFIQVANDILNAADTATQQASIELFQKVKKIHDMYKEKHGNISMEKMYTNLVDDQLDLKGNTTGKKTKFLRGEYNASFYQHLENFNAKIHETKIASEGNPDNAEFQDAYNKALKDRRDWLKVNTVQVDNKWIPTSRWKNKPIEHTTEEKALLDFLNWSREQTAKKYGEAGNLDIDYNGVIFRKLPAVNKDLYQNLTDKDSPMTIAKNWFDEKFRVRSDDTEFVSDALIPADEDNKPIGQVPIYFRRESTNQSLDLLTIHMLDQTMAINYENKRAIEPTLLLMKDIAADRKVGVTKTGTSGLTKFKNMFSDPNKRSEGEIDGVDSNAYKLLESMLEAKLYGVQLKGSDQLNKLVRTITGYTSDVIMEMNWMSTIPNLIQGTLNTYIESYGDSGIPTWAIRQAEKEYAKLSPEALKDIGRMRPVSKLNLLNEYYNPQGGWGGFEGRLSRDTRTKNLLSKNSLYMTTHPMEHKLHSTTMLGALVDNLLMDKDRNYLDKEGKVTKDPKKAATLLDYHIVDSENEGLTVNPIFKDKAKYTSKFDSPIGPDLFNRLSLFIRDINIVTQGNYSSNEKSHAQRNVFFNAAESLRRWIIPGFEKKYRGMATVFSDDDTTRVLNSRRRGARRSGEYTDTVRFVRANHSALTRLKTDILKSEWSELTPRERGNIRKTIIQVGTYIMLSSSAYLLSKLAGELDDDEAAPVVFAIYNLKRARSELAFYVRYKEFERIMRSPAASLSMIEKFHDLNAQVLSDLTNFELERYERGERAGETKVAKRFQDVIPVFSQIDRNVKQALQYHENPGIR